MIIQLFQVFLDRCKDECIVRLICNDIVSFENNKDAKRLIFYCNKGSGGRQTLPPIKHQPMLVCLSTYLTNFSR